MEIKAQDRFYRCSCGDSHWLNIHCYEPFTHYPVVSIVETHAWYPPLWNRIKIAWKMIRGKQHEDAEIILTPEKIDLLIADLQEARAWAEEVERKAQEGNEWAQEAVQQEQERDQTQVIDAKQQGKQ